VNGWYGVYLYGLGIGDQRIADLGRLLMATELRFAMFSHEYLATKKEVETTTLLIRPGQYQILKPMLWAYITVPRK
jgi:hypothetical protein